MSERFDVRKDPMNGMLLPNKVDKEVFPTDRSVHHGRHAADPNMEKAMHNFVEMVRKIIGTR